MAKHIKKLGFVIKTSDRARSVSGDKKARSTRPPKAGPELHSVSHYHQRPGVHPIPNRFHDDSQCVELITGGRGWVENEAGKLVEVIPGDLMWHVPGNSTVGRSDFENPYSCLSVRFRSWEKRPVPHITRWEDLDEVKHFTHQVVRLRADESFDSGVLLRYILARIEFQAALHERGQKERGLPKELRRALELLERNYGEPLRLRDLADAAGWSVPHLHDRFKQELGISPHQALIRRRLQAARELLAAGNDPIKSVSAQCGFPTPAVFCVQFKKATQHSPADYRRRLLHGQG